ncbi:MAG: RHS repeat-associated core domain-containing protein [Planctomycetota bacterium]|nr:RHS repeat-associated core domain-containing protein [Planctomycetota bacterium]
MPQGKRTPVFSAGTANNPFFYTGQRLDPETGLMYYKNRYFDTGLGRFVSRWVSIFEDLNLYQYQFGRATTMTDPMGDPGEELGQVKAAADWERLNNIGKEALKAAIEEYKAERGMRPKDRLPWHKLRELAADIAQDPKYTRVVLIAVVVALYADAGIAAEGACERIACLTKCKLMAAGGELQKAVITIVSIDPLCYCYWTRGMGGAVWYSETGGVPWHDTGFSGRE